MIDFFNYCCYIEKLNIRMRIIAFSSSCRFLQGDEYNTKVDRKQTTCFISNYLNSQY